MNGWKCARNSVFVSVAEFWIRFRLGFLVCNRVGPAIEAALLNVVEFAGRVVITKQIAAVVRPVEVIRPGLPIEANRVAQSRGEGCFARSVSLKAEHCRSARVFLFAGIATRSDR